MRNLFIGFLIVVAIVGTVLFFPGCTVNQQFVGAVNETWQVIGPRYCEYVKQDATLDEESKATRVRTAQLLTEVIEEAKR